MLVFPKLQPIAQKDFTISEFEGLDRRLSAGEKTLSYTENMSVARLPCLTTRRGRRRVFSAPSGEKITGIFNFDKAYLTTSYGGSTKLYYGNDFSSLSCIYTANTDDNTTSMLCRFDNKVCIFNLKSELGSDNLLVSSVTTMDSPTRYSAPVFNDIVVYENRVFGCRLRQIRACAYDDISNWDVYEQREDPEAGAYLKNFETKSEFTACINYKGHTLFFTADEMYELYGKDKLSFDLIKVADFGCLNRFSVCEVSGVLYFLAKDGVMRYNGNTISLISDAICDRSSDASKAALGGGERTLYVKICGKYGDCLYTYNTETGCWAREDSFEGVCATCYDGRVFFADEEAVYKLDVPYSEEPQDNDGASFLWEAVTQDIHNFMPLKKRGSKLNFYIFQQMPSKIEVYISYDGGEFELLRTSLTDGGKTICIPLPNKSYESIKVKIRGWGEAHIDYISRSFSMGGECK